MTNTRLICINEYVTMHDSTRLAVSSWLPNDHGVEGSKYPVILITTRYWRANAFYHDEPEFQKYYPFAHFLMLNGYVLVAADARGSGASFGSRETEYSPAEVEDIGEVIEWVARQEWCDGRVVTEGTSYTAQTALYSLVTAPSALKAAVCHAPDFDMYRHLFAPGGIANHWFIESWGAVTQAQDSNDVEAVFAAGYPPPLSGADNLSGVRPVDDDEEGLLLAEALAEHQSNFNVGNRPAHWVFVDAKPFGSHCFLFEPAYKERIETSNIPIVIRCGWHDAGTALGALSMITSFSNPMRVILGPWNHSRNIRVDPFENDGEELEISTPETVYGLTFRSVDDALKQSNWIDKDRGEYFGCVEYYTLGENCWKITRQWPLPQTTVQLLYLAEKHQLSGNKPVLKEGVDRYQVDPTNATGPNSRWRAQEVSKPILFPDRQKEDKKLLVYDTPPLEKDVEITGHPVVNLYIRSSATDGQFFAYLETIDPDGRVRMLTEGQLRALHRKISDEVPPYRMFGPYHSLKKKDAQPLIPGEVAQITFDLYPISVLLKKGQRIRLAIAGADKDVFAPIPGCEEPQISIERNSIYASYIELPIII